MYTINPLIMRENGKSFHHRVSRRAQRSFDFLSVLCVLGGEIFLVPRLSGLGFGAQDSGFNFMLCIYNYSGCHI